MLSRHFAELIPASHTVLDVGCGDGLIDTLILQRRPDLQLEGVDVLVRPGARIPVTPFDGERLPFADRAWDTVLFCDVLHHTDDPAGMLREAARVARRSILIKDHTVEGFLARPTLRFMDFIGNAPHGVVLPYNYLSRQEWVHVFGSCRLDVKELRTRLGLYPRWADPIFGRSLHFVALLSVPGSSAE